MCQVYIDLKHHYNIVGILKTHASVMWEDGLLKYNELTTASRSFRQPLSSLLPMASRSLQKRIILSHSFFPFGITSSPPGTVVPPTPSCSLSCTLQRGIGMKMVGRDGKQVRASGRSRTGTASGMRVADGHDRSQRLSRVILRHAMMAACASPTGRAWCKLMRERTERLDGESDLVSPWPLAD
jgi:hypothetical protein